MTLWRVRSTPLLALATLVAVPLAAQDFRAAFDKYVHDDSVVGGAYVVVDHGRITEWHGVGMADRERHESIDSNTIFHWASITKTFTAVAMMQLRDRHRLSLDDHIIDYCPELLAVHADSGSVRDVTLRQLLSHSAGFQNPTWTYKQGLSWEPFEPTHWEQLVAMMPYQQVAFRPGARYSYSNPGFIYLGRVIESLSGDPYALYIVKNIFMPLGMTHSYMNVTPYYLEAHRSNNYTVTNGVVTANGRDFDTGITTANSGLNAPLGDMARYVGFLTSAVPTVLARATLDEMWRPVVRIEPGSWPETPAAGSSMGLSFFIFPRGNVTFVGHTGEQAGYRSFLFINPANGKAIVGSLNTTHAENSGATAAGYDALREKAFDYLR
jgi:CubicO group peptidase (beta-lactamase class C family)